MENADLPRKNALQVGQEGDFVEARRQLDDGFELGGYLSPGSATLMRGKSMTCRQQFALFLRVSDPSFAVIDRRV